MVTESISTGKIGKVYTDVGLDTLIAITVIQIKSSLNRFYTFIKKYKMVKT